VRRGVGTDVAVKLPMGVPDSPRPMSVLPVRVGGAEEGCTLSFGSAGTSMSMGCGPSWWPWPCPAGSAGAERPFGVDGGGPGLPSPELTCAVLGRLPRTSDEVDAKIDADRARLFAAASSSGPVIRHSKADSSGIPMGIGSLRRAFVCPICGNCTNYMLHPPGLSIMSASSGVATRLGP
jgi:hypothetical protein